MSTNVWRAATEGSFWCTVFFHLWLFMYVVKTKEAEALFLKVHKNWTANYPASAPSQPKGLESQRGEEQPHNAVLETVSNTAPWASFLILLSNNISGDANWPTSFGIQQKHLWRALLQFSKLLYQNYYHWSSNKTSVCFLSVTDSFATVTQKLCDLFHVLSKWCI